MGDDGTMQELERYAAIAEETAENLDALARGKSASDSWLVDSGLSESVEVENLPYDVWLAIENVVLEVYGTARIGADTIDMGSVTIVTGIGGPHTEIELTWKGEATYRGYWASDKVEKWIGTYSALADTIAESLGGWDQ